MTRSLVSSKNRSSCPDVGLRPPQASGGLDRTPLRFESTSSCDPAYVAADSDPVMINDSWIAEIYPSLHQTAWKMTGDRSIAEDLAQETLIVAIQSWHRFESRSNRAAWVHGILIRLIRKHFRSLARLRRRIAGYLLRVDSTRCTTDVADLAAESEWRLSIWAQVAKLPREQAESIALRYGQQLTYDQIATALDCPTGTVKSRVHLGLRRLRESFSTLDFHD